MPSSTADSSGGSPASTAPRGGGNSNRGTKRSCQVPGCEAQLGAGFYWKYRVCHHHSRAPVIVLGSPGVEQRFCQQCSKFHALEDFDGERHSCRASLQRHQQRRRRRKLQQREEPPPKGVHGAPLDEEEEEREEEEAEEGEGEGEQEAQQRLRQPRGKRQRSSQGSRQAAQPASPGRSSKKRGAAKPKAAPAKPAPPQEQHQPLPLLAAAAAQPPSPRPSALELEPQPLHPAEAAGQGQAVQPAAPLAAASPQGPTSPLSDSTPPDALPRQATASSQAAATAPASVACRVQSSQLDWEALLGPTAPQLPLPPLGMARERRNSSSHASWPNLPSVSIAELEDLCAIETPLFAEWERPQPAAAAALAERCPQPPAAWSQPRPAALADGGGLQVPLPVPWQDSMQPCTEASSVPSAAQTRAALMHPTGLALEAAQPPQPPMQPPPQWQQWLPSPAQECALPLQQLGWQAPRVDHPLPAACSFMDALPAPPPLPAAAPSAGVLPGSPGCGMAWGAPGLDAAAVVVAPAWASRGAAPAWQHPAAW